MRTPQDCAYGFKKIAESLDVIGILTDVLAENTIARESADDANPEPQLNYRCEAGIQAAVRLIAGSAYRELSQMATDLGVPQ
ncbi:hypothetical protein N5D61_05330 [Pseudomonas sp. GD03842]|uniref:hypothetical protein n=1 Tax=Pseudomonas sp. GD03842 TaxID=2975385 RepID=UPI002446CA26|nr:hypothetical protein [Pseudomonas sp. GD03842]MDH0745761.1 hypothetical protein [Pseudomonas sp. GD03842]